MVSFKGLLILYLGAEALAKQESKSSVTCGTTMGTVSVKSPKTKSSTKTTTVTITKQINKSINRTVTPKPITVTITNTKTSTSTHTAGPNTKTATETITDYETSTETETETRTETATETSTSVSTSTSTIPPPANFTPFANDANNGAGGDGGANKRALDMLMPRGKKKTDSSTCKNGKPQHYPPQYPQAVNCVQTLTETATKTVVKTVVGVTVTLAPKTKSVTTKVTTTETATEFPPDASETVTTHVAGTVRTSTETKTETETTTSTVTELSVVATSVHSACLANNLMSVANGDKDTDLLFYNTALRLQVSAATAYDCCISCFTTYADSCVGISFYRTCEILQPDSVCTPGQFTANRYVTAPSPNGYGYTLGNGPCGRWSNGGTHT